MWFVVKKKKKKKKKKREHNKNKGERGERKSVGPRGVWAQPGQASGGICHFIVLSLHWYNLERALLLKAASEWHMGSWCEAQLPRASSRPKVFLWESTEQLSCFFKRQQPPSPSLVPSLPPSLSSRRSLTLSLFFPLPQTLTSHCPKQ